MQKEIIIAQRGWVFIGDAKEEGDDIVIQNGEVIRKWGTTRGVGQLAIEGRQPDTKTDPCGEVRFNKFAVIGRIKVTATW